MSAIEYLNSLIEGQKVSSLPVHPSELEFLKKLIELEKKK